MAGLLACELFWFKCVPLFFSKTDQVYLFLAQSHNNTVNKKYSSNTNNNDNISNKNIKRARGSLIQIPTL